ncbi:MAG TPA: calcium/proton exchanger [Oculatellaceae cyanobacterium]
MKLELKPEIFIYSLFVFTPVPIIGHFTGMHPTAILITSCLGIVPLAALMGKSTEYLAEHVGPGLGGLLNATFGNACELIIAFAALRAGLVDVVKASITGSIIGNILLVLGGSMLAGGMRYETQKFNRTAATTSATLLALAAISLCVPAVFRLSATHTGHQNETKLSLAISVVQFTTYILSLIFSLKTHKTLYGGGEAEGEAENTDDAENTGDAEESEQETIGWSKLKSIIVLLISTVLVAILSECLVHAVEEAARHLGLTQLFIGVVLVAIVGNAAEHSTAVMMAMKNKMDLAINIALGSGAQIALFVAPLIVFASFAIGHPMDLCFTAVELLAVVVSVIILSFVATDGECNWLEGVQLLATYAILAAAFFFG